MHELGFGKPKNCYQRKAIRNAEKKGEKERRENEKIFWRGIGGSPKMQEGKRQ